MRKLVRSQSKKEGLAPGSAVFVGIKRAKAVETHVIDFDETQIIEKQLRSIEECLEYKDRPTVTWINVIGLHESKMIQALAEGFGLHPLVQSDILNTTQRPKFDDYGDYHYANLKMVQWDHEKNESISEQVSLVLGPNYVLSFQERPGDVFEPIRNRLRTDKGRIRTMKSDYLVYCLMDAIVDGYFTILEHLGDKIEEIELAVVDKPGPDTLKDIHRIKREGLLLRKGIWPFREVISGLDRSESELLSKATHLYLRDVYDHTVQVIDTMETFRDLLAGMLDTYLSSLSNRMNEVMKVLTIIATIFIPLTFIAGVYGMNFKNIPEVQWQGGYVFALVIMAIIACGMLYFFRRKKWL